LLGRSPGKACRNLTARGRPDSRVTGVQGWGVRNATVTLHVLNAGGEVYQRQARAASSELMRGIYSFEHIEPRYGTDRAYTTCTVTIGHRTMSAVGRTYSLVEGAKASTMSLNGKNITIITYGGVVDERLVLK